MGTKNKRKNHKSRQYKLTNKIIRQAGGLLAQDETFKPIPHQAGMWVSNYGRVLSARQNTAKIIKPFYMHGYRRLHIMQTKYNKRVSKAYSIHRLVAEQFVAVGDWINPEDDLQVHHIHPVDRKHPTEQQDYASNLMWIPQQLHHAIDSITKIELQINNNWERVDFVKASELLDTTPYIFFDKLCGKNKDKPLKIDADGLEYFDFNGQLFRIFRRKKKKSE